MQDPVDAQRADRPLRDATNACTPSPKDLKADYCRRHSPWTAPRDKKKQRDRQQDAHEPRGAAAGGITCCLGSFIPQQVIQVVRPVTATAPTLPSPTSRTVGATAGCPAPAGGVPCAPVLPDEDDIACQLGACQIRAACSSSGGSAHSSPAVDRTEQCDLHPAKAYIIDRQVCTATAAAVAAPRLLADILRIGSHGAAAPLLHMAPAPPALPLAAAPLHLRAFPPQLLPPPACSVQHLTACMPPTPLRAALQVAGAPSQHLCAASAA